MKKTKLLSSVLSLCFSLLALSFGVYAAVKQVDYSVNGTISYEVTDAYVTIDTAVYTTSTAYSLASTFKTDASAFEQGSVTSGYNKDTSNTIEQYNSLTNTGTNEHELNLQYNDTAKANVIVFTVTNLSDTQLYVKIVDAYEMSIYTYNSFIYRSNDVLTLEAKGTTTLVAGFALYDPTISIESMDYGFSLQIGTADNYSPLKADVNEEYYYLEMGDFYGLPIRWRMYGQNAETPENVSAGKTNLITYFQFDANTLPTGITGVFIQETCPNDLYGETYDQTWETYEEQNFLYTELEDDYALTWCNFNAYKTVKTTVDGKTTYTYYAVDDNGEQIGDDILANNYFYSNIRDYINGTEVCKRLKWDSTNQVYLPNSETVSTLQGDLNISSDNYIYQNIIKRNLSDMTTYSGDYDDTLWVQATDDDNNLINIAPTSSTEQDAMWLLSIEEAYLLMADVDPTQDGRDNLDICNALNWGGYNNATGDWWNEEEDFTQDYLGSYYWLRSCSASGSSSACDVNLYGYADNYHANYDDFGARPAFQFSI